MMTLFLRKTSLVVLTLFLFVSSSFAGKKIVLIAGPLDDHPIATHEYENNILLIKDCLENSTNVHGATIETYFNGWPENPAALDDADTIFLTSGGSDRKESDHPLYVGDHFAQFDKQMKRGCGLVLYHWSTFHPERVRDTVLDWIGGYFDYETGTNGPTKKWFSKIETHQWSTSLASPSHPVARGVKPFSLTEEFYFNLRFRENDSRWTPILFNAGDSGSAKRNVVGWAVERADGGRAFGFTGGHFYTNWWLPDFRKLILNAIVWTAKMDVPVGGVESSISEKIQSLPSKKGSATASVKSPEVPASKTKKLRPAMKQKDSGATAKEEAWKDGRWNQTDVGQFLASNLHLDSGAVMKALSIRVGEHDEAAVCYDTETMQCRAGWTGKFLEFDPTRFGLIITPKIGGEVHFLSSTNSGWDAAAVRYSGLSLNGKRVVLGYSINSVRVRETPWFETRDGIGAFTRTIEVGPSERAQQFACLAIGKDEHVNQRTINGIRVLTVEKNGKLFAAATSKSAPGALDLEVNGRVVFDFHPHKKSQRCKLFFWSGAPGDLEKFVALVKKSSKPEDLDALSKPGPAHWNPPLVTKGEVAFQTEPYVLDSITVPYDNPWKALFFLSGVDFFANGDAAVCTIHGDVWIVKGIDSTLQKITWKRFATGLFQPLGLRIVDNKIYVLGRDQITVLHDNNGDGEADYYENFSNKIKTLENHNYVTSLEVDPQKNFYYADWLGVHRVSADGQRHETICTGFRNPNGMSISPDGRVITVAPQEGHWTPSSAICEIKLGGFYGFEGPQVTPERPLGYDPPLCWIPRLIDNSTGSQFWATSDRWGPLQNQLFSLSFGRCTMMQVLRDVVDGQAQGAVVPWKLHFLSGAMRATFRPQDGQLYVVGTLGWSTGASKDGSFQRVRYTGKKVYTPERWHVCQNGIELGFTQPLERESAEDVGSYGIEEWNYLYSKNYGSKEYSVTAPETVGHDAVEIESAKLLPDGRSVFLKIPGLQPVMQMEIKYNVNAADGKAMRGEIYNTINRVGPAKN